MSVTADAVNISPAAAAQPQCQFFVLRKKRLCRMTVRPGRQYCGEHEPQPVTADQEIDKRVPCPNDPKHTCYESKLEKHLAKCNARKVEDPPYIIRNINDPEDEDLSPRVPLKDVPTEILQQVINKINLLYDKHVKSTISMYSPPAEHHPAVAESIAEADRTDSSRRHLRQASRLLQLAEDEGLVAEGTCYVELGAGKGMLSYYMGVWWCARGSRVVCVDRAALRHKRDNLLGARAARLRADLRHLQLGGAPAVADAAAIVGVAKHLCGVATDYALRCMTGATCVRRARGVLLATCCHHRCERGAYVGARPLQELGISGEELNVIFGVVSWATCGDGRSRERRRAAAGHPHHPAHHTTLHEHTQTEETTGNQSKKRRTDFVENQSEDTKHLDSTQGNDAQNIENTTNLKRNRDIENDSEEPTLKDAQTKSEKITNGETDKDLEKQSEISADNTSEVKSSEQAPRLALPISVREETGRRAKALLDYGRVLFLRQAGFSARLCYYVPTTESLENVCIVAKKEVL